MRRFATTMFATALAITIGPAASSFASSFGTLSNFDVVNDTGHSCHGFEIELEDMHPSDVAYTFGGSYIRYGTPEVLDATIDPAHPRVVVRYRSWSGSEWAATPVAPAGVTPSGHDCYSGGPVGNYLSSGCEHYGVSLRANPSRTTYRWLVAANPNDAGSAFSVEPETVNLPVPVWNVIPRPAGGVDVRAEVEPVEEENHVQRGEPQWLKVYKIESDLDLQPEDLNRLLLGVAGGIVPDDETEIESEWKLIQSKPGNAEGDEEDADIKEDPLDDGKRSVIRRYEFYAFTGPRDPENNEAFPCIDGDQPVPEAEPLDGCSDLGDFVGAQNVAVDVDLATVDNALPAGEVGIAYPDTPLVIGGLPPYAVQVTAGAVPDGLEVDAATGILAGQPTVAGAFSFDILASDSAGDDVTGTFDVLVDQDLCPDDPDKDAPGACGCGLPDDDSDGDLTADCLDLCPFDPAKTDPGLCGCDVPEGTCGDLCPDDPAKTDPGVCGCGVADADSDGDGSEDCLDACPADSMKTAPGVCGCGVTDGDTNGNGVIDCQETTLADLSASIRQSPATPKAGKRLRFQLRVTNLGPDDVAGATIEASVSGGPFSGLELPKGCSGTEAAIVCSTAKIPARSKPASKSRTIRLIPEAGASVTVSATVSSPVYDPNPANQTATVTAIVP